MTKPQLEDGYTRLANAILDNMAKIKLSPTQYRILFVVWRYTYGFQRKEHNMSLSFLVEATGCDKRQIQREVKSLDEKKIIKQNIKNGSYRKISFNKNFDEWTVGGITVGDSTIGETNNGETAYGGVGETAYGTIGETAYQERNKDNFKEIKEEEENKVSKIISFWDSNGFGAQSMNQKMQLLEWIDDGCFDEPHEIIIKALEVACDYNAKTIKYVNRVLSNWSKEKKLRTLKQVEQAIEDHENGKRVKVRTKSKAPRLEDFDLDDD